MQKIILFLSLILIYHAGSQSLHVFDVDTTDFPIMRAKFYAFDAEGKQISDLQPSDFEVTENDEPREVLNISCPTPQPPTAISSVLTIDVSGSMSGNSIEMAKEAAKSWVNALPLGKSECAITSFTLTNQYIQDFTTNRSRLLEKINGLYADGGTDFDAAFVNPIAGGLLVLEKAKHKKVMVLITDGYASGNESNIISKAQALDAEVYCVTLGFECPEILKNISEQTGGKWFENVTTIDQALEVYSKILLYSQRNEPCAIEWQSKLSCISNIINCKYSVPYLSQESTLNYFLSQNKVKRLAFEPSAILYFNKPLGERADTIITVTAQNADFNIANITCNSAEFDINPKSFSLKQGESKQLTITLTPSNKDYKFEVFSIETDVCDTKYSCYSKHIGQPGTSNPTLKLTHPIGGEEFLVGTDTIITWEGVAQSDTISIEYSSDNGNNWKFINTTASGHSHKWNDIPKPTSNTCKVRIRSNEVNVYKTDRDIIDLSGHVGPLYSIDWSPNGNQVATAGLDISGRIWDARTGAMLHNLSKQTPFLYNISWSPDGTKVATACYFGHARIWDASTGTMLHELPRHFGHLYRISWSSDGNRIATASEDSTSRIWDVNSGTLLHVLSGHTSIVYNVEWSPDGTKIATTSADSTCRIWDASSGNLLHKLSGHTGQVECISWNPDGTMIATTGLDKTGIIWDAINGTVLHKLSEHTAWVRHISWSPDGTKIATASDDFKGRIWDTSSGTLLHELVGHTAQVVHISWSPNGNQVATASSDNTGCIWNAFDGKQIRVLTGHKYGITQIKWSPNGREVATVSTDGTGRIWDANSGSMLHNLSGHTGQVECISWNPGGTMVATASWDCTGRIWDASSGALLNVLSGHTGNVKNISWSPDGTKVATASGDRTGRIWDASSGALLHDLSGHSDEVKCISWSPNGTKVATASADDTGRIWDANSGAMLHNLSGHTRQVECISWSPDGTKVATASFDKTGRIWDASTGELLHALSGHTYHVTHISWSPDGTKVATASGDSTGIIWDVNTGELLQTLEGHTLYLNHIRWSQDGTKVATASDDKTGKIWDASTGELLHTLSGHTDHVTHISWSPDDTKVATASDDNTGRIWDANTGQLLHTLEGHTYSVLHISWSPNGRKVATASDDGSGKIWILDSNSYDQEDISDIFSIVAPEVSSHDINMGDVVVNSSKDSVITEFIDNIGQWDCRIDSVYFEGADAAYFGLNGPIPVYSVAVGEKQMSEFKFSPTEVRDYTAQVVVITQADTLKQNIYGRGVEEQIAANAEIIDFGIHELYDYADSTVALIQNVTPNPIQITKIEMLGPDKEQFIFNDSKQIQPFTLAGNTAYSLNLRFNPKYIGRTSGQVAFHFNGAGSPAIAQLYGAGIGAELSASTDTAYVGDVIGIDISFDNNDIAKFAEVIGSFEGVVRVESSILGTLHKENLVEIKADSAYIKFKGEINSASNIIATIPLKVALGRVESTSIDFEYVKWFDTEGNEIDYDTEFTSGFFKQLGICEDGGKRFFNPDGIVGISNLSPNPAENRIQIDFSVIEAGYTEITLVNMLGQTVATLFAEDISDFQDRQIIQDISEIGSGQYILQFKTPTYVERRKVMVVR